MDDGMLECYEELSGPYRVTLLVQPEGIGEIDFNTLDIEDFPWSGDYFGGMENKIKAKVFNEFEDTYEFSHWVSTSGNIIFPDSSERKATITLTEADTLIAVFDIITSTSSPDTEFSMNVFPNPAKDYLTLQYELDQTMDVNVSLYSVLGQKVADFQQASGHRSAGSYSENLPLDAKVITSGLYFLVVNVEDQQLSFKVNIMK